MSALTTAIRSLRLWIRPESGAKEESQRVTNFLRMSLRDKLSALVQFVRGFWLSRKFDTKGLILAGKSIKIVKRNGEIHVDRYCRIRNGVSIAVVGKDKAHKAVLRIGYDSGISDRTKINVTTSVTIGKGCSIGWDCDIWDTSWHRVLFLDRESGPVSAPVVIEDHVWVGSHSIIQKGVTIGANSVIAAGSVVTKDIPPNSLAGGVPARVIKQIAGWDRNPDKDVEGAEQ